VVVAGTMGARPRTSLRAKRSNLAMRLQPGTIQVAAVRLGCFALSALAMTGWIFLGIGPATSAGTMGSVAGTGEVVVAGTQGSVAGPISEGLGPATSAGTISLLFLDHQTARAQKFPLVIALAML
jgi:hypothetical protein